MSNKGFILEGILFYSMKSGNQCHLNEMDIGQPINPPYAVHDVQITD